MSLIYQYASELGFSLREWQLQSHDVRHSLKVFQNLKKNKKKSFKKGIIEMFTDIFAVLPQ